MTTVFYLCVGKVYRLVGILSDGNYIGFGPGKKLGLKSTEFGELNWSQEAAQLLQPLKDGARLFATHLSENPKQFESGLKFFMKDITVKVLIPKSCRVLKADDRREYEEMGFLMSYCFEEGVLVEKAVRCIDVDYGWAVYLQNMAMLRGLDAEIKSDRSADERTVFSTVTFKVSVDTLDDARAVQSWLSISELEDLHYAVPENDLQKRGRILVKVRGGYRRSLVCFLTDTETRPNDQIVGRLFRIRVQMPSEDRTSGTFWLLDEMESM